MYRIRPMMWVWIFFGALLVVSSLLWFASPYGGSWSYPGYYGMPMMGGFFMGPWVMIVGLLFVAFIALSLFRYGGWGYSGYRRGCMGGGYRDAEEILRERYARGELTREQYDQMLRDLRERIY